uniref:Microphthalmia-associated transcription factor n=1 Tax=Haemonchus placei TaxID=6290 RepID=A0A0N4VSG3_HAEPC
LSKIDRTAHKQLSTVQKEQLYESRSLHQSQNPNTCASSSAVLPPEVSRENMVS